MATERRGPSDPPFELSESERQAIIERAREKLPEYDRHFRELMAEYDRLERPWWQRLWGSEAG